MSFIGSRTSVIDGKILMVWRQRPGRCSYLFWFWWSVTSSSVCKNGVWASVGVRRPNREEADQWSSVTRHQQRGNDVEAQFPAVLYWIRSISTITPWIYLSPSLIQTRHLLRVLFVFGIGNFSYTDYESSFSVMGQRQWFRNFVYEYFDEGGVFIGKLTSLLFFIGISSSLVRIKFFMGAPSCQRWTLRW
jgi:hypothetical protein